MKFSLICGLLLLGVSSWPAAIAAEAPATAVKPNIVVILADDLGYGDVQCYNPQRGKIPTPALDRLAAEGMRFTDAHASSGVCSPSRYTLLTGRYHWRTRLQRGIVGLWERPLIAPGRLTIAGLTAMHGYRSACIGKWHLGWDWGIAPEQKQYFTGFKARPVTDAHREAWREVFSLPIGGGPTAAGFGAYFGTDVPNWPPHCFIEDNRTLGIPVELLDNRLIGNNQGSQQGPGLAGWTFKPILPALTERACGFIADSARRKAPFLLYLPLTTPHTPLAVNQDWQGKSGLDSPVADLIMETDAAVGRVLQALEDGGVAGNTLVVFTSDNGFAPYAGVKELEARGHYPSGPLRGYKGDAWEGGHRVPFIVRWPGQVPAAAVSHHLVHHADLMATLAGILGTKLPENAGEDSFSLLPLLRGADRPPRDHAVSQSMNGLFAVRQGSWKLVAGPGSGGSWSSFSAKLPGDAGPQLYDLAADPGETRNRHAEEPGRAAALRGLLERLIAQGRSTPGTPQSNDVKIR
jgi:arylsulfatase A-like enzyme